MDPQQILLIILVFVAANYVFEQLLDYLNLSSGNTIVPESMRAFYDEEKYAKSIAYHQTTSRFGFLTGAFSFVLSFLMLYLGGFGWVDGILRPFFSNEIILSLVFFGVLGLASDILSLPFQLYSTFVIEERFGFNKTSVKHLSWTN